VFAVPWKSIIDQYPDDVKRKIDLFVGEGLSPRAIYEWLEANVYPQFRESGSVEFCVSRKTVYNYMKKHVPEKRVVFGSYIREALKRVDDDIDAMAKLREYIRALEGLLGKFDLSGKLSLREIGEMRRLLHELTEATRKHVDLEIRLGLREGKEEESKENILDRLRGELEEKEKKKKEKEAEVLGKAVGT